MALWLHAYGGYPSYGYSGEQWQQDDYRALKLIQALKGKPVKGWAWFARAGGKWSKVCAEDPSPAFEIFGEWAGARIKQIGIAAPRIVPVPSSNCVKLGDDPKGMKIAEAVAKFTQGAVATGALHWDEALKKAHEGGTRDPNILYGKLWVATELDPRPIVLVDDVGTTGGHVVACARALRHFGYQVEHALCAGQTVNTHPANMFDIAARDLEAGAPLFF